MAYWGLVFIEGTFGKAAVIAFWGFIILLLAVCGDDGRRSAREAGHGDFDAGG